MIMNMFTVEEIESRIRNGEIIYERALENNAGTQLLAFLRRDIIYWRSVLARMKGEQEGTQALTFTDGEENKSAGM